MIVRLLSNISFYIPELITIVSMCSLLFLESTYDKSEKKRGFVFVASIIGFIVCLFALINNMKVGPTYLFSNAVIIDQFGTSMKIIMTLASLGVLFIHGQSKDIDENLKSEFLILSFGVLLGGFLLVSATNFLTLYLGIETLSILSYVMASLNKDDSLSTEAGIKYVLYGGVSAGVMLFGISHLYGVFGSINFIDVLNGLQNIDQLQFYIALISILLIFVGIGYKISCFPFHMWAPDVYQGSPIPVTCFFSMVPKIAGIASLIRVSLIFINNTQSEIAVTWTSLLVVVAALTMIVGNFSALNQDSVKRMLAYSSIGHVGLILLGVITMGKEGTQSILFYSFSYIFMTLVSFFIVAKVNDAYKNDSHNCFKGLVRKNPLMAISFSIALFSLAGMPPFSGFIAKFQMISVAVKSQFYGLAIIAAIMSVVSLYFYLRLVKMMLIDETEDGVEIKNFGLSNYITTIVMTAPVIVFGIFWESVMNWFGTAELFLKI